MTARLAIPFEWRLSSLVSIASVVLAFGCQGHPSDEEVSRAASRLHDERVSGTRIPEGLGVERAVVLTTRVDLSDEHIFVRDDSPEVESSADAIVTVVTMLAGLRTGLVTAATRHQCDGYNCWRVHGSIEPSDALAQSCNSFFESLASRLSSGAMAPAFIALGLETPAIPEARFARVEFATHASGWSLSPRRALRLARSMYQRPAPWFDFLERGLVVPSTEARALHGKSAGTTSLLGWFVGYITEPEPRLYAVRVSGCTGPCSERAIQLTRWSVRRVRAVPARPSATPH